MEIIIAVIVSIVFVFLAGPLILTLFLYVLQQWQGIVDWILNRD